ncbi:MAG: MDR family oxidoreductase [Kiloniellales bacterium]
MFKALVLREDDGKVSSAIEQLEETALPEGDVTVRVSHSTLNYKDGMVVNGIGRLVRNYPHVPGVDFAGTVEQSDHPDHKAGDPVVLTGWRVGETHWGGYAELARVKGDWLVPLPEGMSAKDAMAVGTAGFTAMLAQQALEGQGVEPGNGPILVTGASGGVGSVAVSLLAKAGFEVAAVTGRPEQGDYLKQLGASQIVGREEVAEAPTRPLDKERWAGCIDNVGGTMLARVLTQMAYGSAVASVGLAGGNSLTTTVLPFLLRGVSVLGIDSVMCPKAKRLAAWQRLARDLDRDLLHSMTSTAQLEEVPALAKSILKGQVRGRKVIEI